MIHRVVATVAGLVFVLIALVIGAMPASAGRLADGKPGGPAVTVQPAPCAPSTLTADPRNSFQVELSWTAPSGNPTGYNVWYKSSSDASFLQANKGDVHQTSYLVSRLSPNTTYSFYVTALYSGGGQSGPSVYATASTPPYPPATSPSDGSPAALTVANQPGAQCGSSVQASATTPRASQSTQTTTSGSAGSGSSALPGIIAGVAVVGAAVAGGAAVSRRRGRSTRPSRIRTPSALGPPRTPPGPVIHVPPAPTSPVPPAPAHHPPPVPPAPAPHVPPVPHAPPVWGPQTQPTLAVPAPPAWVTSVQAALPSHPAHLPSIQAVPHADPPPVVSVETIGRTATRTIRFVPYPGASTTSTEEVPR